MIILQSTKVLARIYESTNSLVYRGLREEDQQPIILKLLKENYPTPSELIRYQQEYEITRNLNLEGVVKAYDLQKYQNTMVMFLEDFGGESLEILLKKSKLSLAEFLTIAIQITDIVGKIHQANIIHKDINPSNIVFNPKNGKIKIIDFGLSTVLLRENATLKSPNILEGTLAYISPEQTGRMNRTIDYRTDFYSLGVTFYELLTNQLPFDSTDAMELVHCHIAKQPVPPHIVNPEVPLIVSKIVMKLMAKTAEDRYQSASGIKADLETCLVQLQANSGNVFPTIELFPLASKDISEKFQIPQKLYGRKTQIETLLTAFDRVSQGQSELMLISGYSGIGKSALVQEIYKPITQQRGYFIWGKFDQLQRNIPYSAVVSAFQELVRQLLTETSEQLQPRRDKLLAALGVNGQIIIDVIPEIELIIGKQPAVPELAPAEAQNRFNLVFQNFIRIFCQKEHPLVIFLDDLQWADSATLKLMQLMITDADTTNKSFSLSSPHPPHSPLLLGGGGGNEGGLFLIGAYRDNEVSAAHPLMLTLSEIQTSGVVVNTILLSPLDLTHVNQLIADTLKCDKERTKPLAELVLAKTHGNPFFMNEFLKSLYTEKLLNFDGVRSVWQWDLEQIQAQGITDNVVELMAQKIQKLPEQTQHCLKLAACIGNQFDLKTLSLVEEKPQKETANHLWSAIQEGLLLPVGDDYKFLQTDRNHDELIVAYKFVHDRIQQAAYSLIAQNRKQAIHLQIGQLLLKNTQLQQREEKIFDIVNQLNFGSNLLDNQQKRDELARLNLIAGKKAKASAAYQPAFIYLTQGLELLPADRWETQYNTTLTLYAEAAEAAYLCGQFDEMERLASVVLQNAKLLLDKVKVYEIKISAYTVQGKLKEAIDTGLTVLKLLGVSLPKKPKKFDILLALIETKLVLFGKRIEDLIHLPQMTAPDKKAVMSILCSVGPAAYFAAPNLFAIIILKAVSLSVKHGNLDLSAKVYGTYGIILCGVLGEIESGYRFGNLALSLVQKLNASKAKASVFMTVNTFINHWREHGKHSLQPLLEGYASGIETGDLEHAAYCAMTYSYNSCLVSQDLAVAEQEITKYRDAVKKIKQERIIQNINLYRQVALNLLGKAENPCCLVGESFDELLALPLSLERNDYTTVFDIYSFKVTLSYLFGEYQQALENAVLAKKYLDGVLGSLPVPIFNFYDSLARLALYPSSQKLQQKSLLRKVQANQKKMKKWAHHAPMNYLHKFYLVEAERHRVLGQDTKAIDYYDKAIALAKQNEYINEEALAHELTAKFYLAKGKDKIAQVYMQDARYFYLRWGAMAKVKDLDTRFPQLLERKSSGKGTLSTKKSTSPTKSGSSTSSELDLTTIMKASQTLSGEMMLDKLLTKLMGIIIENAGAQKGFLILETKGKLLIEASGIVDSDHVTVLQSIPIENSQDVSAAIISYVSRTQESVVFDDAASEIKNPLSPYAPPPLPPLIKGGSRREGQIPNLNDPYIKEHQPKSILCSPLINQGKLTGIIYLENNLTTQAFTPERVEVLNLLSSQAAISIENARLYKNMAELNQAFERFVPRQFLQFLDKESIVDVQLGDQVQQEMSVLFSDIRDFTTLSESMTPQDNFKFINAYLSRMEPAIIENQGFIDKYIGDAIMALFSGEADNAVKAGIDMLKRLAKYNQHRAISGYVPLKIGIGINTGSLMLGTVGGKNRMDSTVISDAVNLASRVESLSKNYGVSMLITQETFWRLQDSNRYANRIIDRVQVKGKSETVSIFEVFDADLPELLEGKLITKTTFEEALLLYNQQKFREAEQLFADCLRLNPMDKVAEIYRQRCQERGEIILLNNQAGIAF